MILKHVIVWIALYQAAIAASGPLYPRTNVTTTSTIHSTTNHTTTIKASSTTKPTEPPVIDNLVNCFQPRASDAPSATDLANLITSSIATVCVDVGTGQGGTAASLSQGYAYYGASSIFRNQDSCLAAFTNITTTCITNGTFYGGEVIVDGELYNLTNAVYPGNPIITGQGAPKNPEKAPQFPPPGPSLPNQVASCPQPFLINQTIDWQVPGANTQWRVMTRDLTDIKAWNVTFIGGATPDVQVSSNPIVASWEMQDPLPAKITITGTFIDGLLNDYVGTIYHTPFFIQGTHTPSEIQATCQAFTNQYSLSDGSFWDAANASYMALVLNRVFQPGPTPFDEFMSKELHGPGNWDCALVQSDCGGGLQCTDVDTPAGYAILESLTGLHNYFNVLYGAMNGAAATVGLDLAAFTQTFAPAVDDGDFLKQLLDVGALLLGFTNAYVGFIAGVEKFGAFDGKLIDKSASAISSIASGGIAIAKDSLPASQQLWINEGDIGHGLVKFINSLQGTLSDYVNAMMTNGSYQSGGTTFTLAETIDQGLWLSDPFRSVDASGQSTTTDSVNVQADFEKLFYGKMMSIAWVQNPKMRPVIIPYQSADQDVGDGTSVTNFYGANTVVQYNNAAYVLYSYDMDKGATPLPGGTRDTLDGTAGNWGGLTIDDIVISSVNGWLLHNLTNGYQMPVPSFNTDGTGATSDIPFSLGAQTPGFFNIPVCSINHWATQYNNPKGEQGSPGDPKFPYFPCDL
ncbi:hypothetical protein B7463_g12088, partial [Scytalidium lignicola]